MVFEYIHPGTELLPTYSYTMLFTCYSKVLQRDHGITKVQAQKHGDTMVILVSQQNTSINNG